MKQFREKTLRDTCRVQDWHKMDKLMDSPCKKYPYSNIHSEKQGHEHASQKTKASTQNSTSETILTSQFDAKLAFLALGCLPNTGSNLQLAFFFNLNYQSMFSIVIGTQLVRCVQNEFYYFNLVHFQTALLKAYQAA